MCTHKGILLGLGQQYKNGTHFSLEYFLEDRMHLGHFLT